MPPVETPEVPEVVKPKVSALNIAVIFNNFAAEQGIQNIWFDSAFHALSFCI